MSMELPLKGQEQVGKLCQGIGAKIGKATITSMGRLFPLRSPPVMVTLLYPTMLLLLIGLLGRLTLVPNSVEGHHNFLKRPFGPFV